MRNQSEIRERFLNEDAKMRLGHIASDLARIASLIGMEMKQEIIKSVIEESKFFAEWTAPDVEPEIQVFLAEIQSFLAQAELQWDSGSNHAQWEEETSRRLRVWSDELLKIAGFGA